MASLQLETSRLLLRGFETSDFGDVHSYAQDPEVCRYQVWGPNSEDETREFLARSIAGMENTETVDLEFAIVERAMSSVVGGVGLHSRRLNFREYEIGWTLGRPNWRRGIGFEAASAVVDYAFATLDAHRLFARIDSENAASIALAVKLGFEREGLQRADSLIDDGWRDTFIYARLSPSSPQAG